METSLPEARFDVAELVADRGAQIAQERNASSVALPIIVGREEDVAGWQAALVEGARAALTSSDVPVSVALWPEAGRHVGIEHVSQLTHE